jgi:hypothetical protein
MTRSSFNAAARAGSLLARMRNDHMLTSERVAGLLGEPPGTVAGWEAGRATPSDSAAARIEVLASQLDFASLQRWKERVTRSRGLEMLIGRDLSILAVSAPVLTEASNSSAGKPLLQTDSFLGRNANEFLPTLDCNLILRHGAGLKDLDAVGMFDGRVRCVRYSAELNYGSFARIGVFEFWPVETVDAGIVAHHVCHPLVDRKPTLSAPGIAVHWREIVPEGE